MRTDLAQRSWATITSSRACRRCGRKVASTAWPTPKPVDDSAGVGADALAVMS